VHRTWNIESLAPWIDGRYDFAGGVDTLCESKLHFGADYRS